MAVIVTSPQGFSLQFTTPEQVTRFRSLMDSHQPESLSWDANMFFFAGFVTRFEGSTDDEWVQWTGPDSEIPEEYRIESR